ncbi:hypothetical protein [Phocaeicola plebeius]|uniref:hypothetical protein n=1 Tax=Phocaeicola plebeius TaxID=310297 RepID=UPI0026ED7FDA|nr:hypothetical protein [Phocaeicola plebeius]
MELKELIENALGRKQLEEIMDRPEREYAFLEGRNQNQNKEVSPVTVFQRAKTRAKQLNEMISRIFVYFLDGYQKPLL